MCESMDASSWFGSTNHLLNDATCFDSLKWLSVSLRGLTVVNTRIFLSRLNNVRALELKVRQQKSLRFSAPSLNIAQKSSILAWIYLVASIRALLSILKYISRHANLVSLSIDGSFSGGVQIPVLFRKISSYRNLQYFRTTTKIPLDLVCYALRRCPNLNHQLHGRDTPGPNDYHKILHLFFYNGSNWARYNLAVQIPSSPWIKFYEDYMPKRALLNNEFDFCVSLITNQVICVAEG
uniref:Uncharacterized protein n=1 Tax=Ditylenchus dipsaci TaxID=166011 RepID=A0A915DWG6_9BILA